MNSHSSSFSAQAPRRRRSGIMPVWISLGMRAFRRSFWCGCFGCDSGGRDFVWLTLLLTLVMTMTLVFVGTRVGFLDRLADTLIGNIEPNGVPVWVTSHWENQQGIDSALLQKLTDMKLPVAQGRSPQEGAHVAEEKSSLTVFPYRRLGDNQPAIHLPTPQSWKGTTPFAGWAVYPNDPLWKLATADATRLGISYEDERSPWLGLPLEVVLSTARFRRHFDYAAYREAVAPFLAEQKRPALPATLDWNDPIRALETLWLRVTVSQEERLIPFKVRWVSHIPSMESIAFLFPLNTYHALLAAHHLPDLRYQPENEGRGDSIQNHRLLTQPDYPRELLSQYAACVQKEQESAGGDERPQVSRQKCSPPSAVARLNSGKKADVPAQTWKNQWDTLNHDRNHQVWIPCQRLSRGDALRGALCAGQSAEAGGNMFVPWDLTHAGLAFSTVHLFVPNATHLAQVIEQIQEIRTSDGRQAFNIHPTYLDAMSRFNLLSDMLGSLIPAFAGSFLLLLTALLFAQIGGVIDRRRNHFGILMSRGFSWVTIYAKVILQMFLATTCSSVVAVFGLVPALRWFVMRDFNTVLSRYRELLPPDHGLDIMPLSWQPIVLTVGGVALAVILVVAILLLRIPLWWHTTPSDLLHGNYANPDRNQA
ncbi:MAG: hypothetical protein HQL64_09760 [Magnetococcales bacterium]|nr:hypothetical protein [Magnetococcales bacterium]